MNKNKSFENQMKKFLHDIDSNKNINYEDNLIRRCVVECIRCNYVSGFHYHGNTADNTIIFDLSNPRVEKLGYEFLHPKRNWVNIVTLISSIIAAIGTILGIILQLA